MSQLALLLCLLMSSTMAAGSAVTQCKALLEEYYQANSNQPAPYTGSNLVYFLHIPRTAGRTLGKCLLQTGTPAVRQCPKAYDHLQTQAELPKCYLLSSHDDFSIMEKLPANTTVVSQLRDPVQRVLSAYEFAVELAARQLLGKAQSNPDNRTLTTDVWPWSYLIPFFVNDIKPKLTALKAVPLKAPGVWAELRADDGRRYYRNQYANTSKWELTDEERASLAPNLDSYDNPMVLSLQEFIRHPLATELLHNGETLQVLGLTNYSHWDKAGALRSCLLEDAAIADELLEFALKRIERFEHVGTTEALYPSVESAAAALKMPLNGTIPGAGEGSSACAAKAERRKANYLPWNGAMETREGAYADATGLTTAGREQIAPTSELLQQCSALVPGGSTQQATAPRCLGPQLSLGAAFHKCEKHARFHTQGRKKVSLLGLRLNDYRQIYFNKEDRVQIPEAVIEEIRTMNALDVKLYQRAQELLLHRRDQQRAAGNLQALIGTARLR